MSKDLSSLLARSRLLVCVGSGGVGKTTTAAALGLRAALAGRRVLVLTIDPARRLANALGLSSIGNEEREIPLPPGSTGSLHALMLDTRSTFDEVIRRVSPDEETRERIFNNKVYRIVSDSFSASQDYMAVEKLYDEWASGRFDLIVLDTPPVKNALDFIEAPGRLARFLDRHIMKWFLAPYDERRVFGRVMVGTSGVVFRLLGLLFGREFLEDLSQFLLAFRDLYDGFRERQDTVVRLFAEETTAFVVITAPNEASFEVASFFAVEFRRRGLPHAGVVVNQLHRCSPGAREAFEELARRARHLEGRLGLPPGTADGLVDEIREAHHRLCKLARREAGFLARARELLPPEGGFLVEVPRLDEPVQDLDGLLALGDLLLGGPGSPRPERDTPDSASPPSAPHLR